MLNWLRRLAESLTDFRSDPVEDFVASSMFSDAKKLSDFIGFIVRSAFCGFAAALLYKKFLASDGSTLDAIGAFFFMGLGVAMYSYATTAMIDYVYWRMRLANRKRSLMVGLGSILLFMLVGLALNRAVLALAAKAAQ